MVSIHAPVKVRLKRCHDAIGGLSFNSRTCEGATPKRGNQPRTHTVSIHAPVKVRHCQPFQRSDIAVSIHAPVKVRLAKVWIFLPVILFQFTHLWRCDDYNHNYQQPYSFQFTHLWRCDASLILLITNSHMFQFTNLWRCDLPFSLLQLRRVFQFTHLWRCDEIYKAWNHIICVSIHAPVKVRRWNCTQPDSCNTVSIHAPVKVRLIS